MIEFWLCAGLLLLVALAFLLIPVLRGRKAQAEEDRTALNVTLYQERLQELQAQHEAGALNDQQLADGRDEAARELLADTEGAQALPRQRRLGTAVPLIASLLVPFVGIGLYMHWGAQEEIEQARQFAQQPKNIEEMTERLELAVKMNPESPESWYFLGRAYMAQDRAAEAAPAFEKAVNLANRAPELLGQWAQALYFAGNKQWTDQLQKLSDEALKADPNEATTLGLLGIAAFEDGRYAEAVENWQKLVALLPADDPSRQAIDGGIQRAREQYAAETGKELEQAAPAAVHQLTVRVDLAAELKDKVQADDAVFVFARAVSGPPMPLAVKRLKVSELPAEITLSDNDAMMPQMKISSFPQVQLGARISRSGNATAGEWVGNGQPVASNSSEPQTLLIDTADSAK
ncbi:c-type cytochrome biogenesis protein CcmI [Ectopseudomonas mendocina]|uniref:C-type cytochrome biogenesis protein CcmI n=1 Tax=Ectopseudomonas mendocina TaxID=300 RepID=A0ABZ2RER8_ECTME